MNISRNAFTAEPSAMIEMIQHNHERISELCRRYRVAKLELFGSAASGQFDPVTSDFDFFYQFIDGDFDDIAARFFDFKDRLETLLGRPVDLVSSQDAKNPYFLAEADRHRQTLYASPT